VPGAWLTGPVPRKYPERNWSVTGGVQTPAGLVEDTIPEDQSLVLNTPEGLKDWSWSQAAGTQEYDPVNFYPAQNGEGSARRNPTHGA
jgi:hypothetical protein